MARKGLLDGVNDRLGPFMAWGALVFSVAFLFGTLIIVAVMLANGEVAVALLVLVIGGLVAALAFWNWLSLRRRMRRRDGKA